MTIDMGPRLLPCERGHHEKWVPNGTTQIQKSVGRGYNRDEHDIA